MLVRLTIVAGFSGEPKGLTGREKDQEEEEQQHNTNVHAGVSGAHLEGDAQSSEDVTEDKRDLNGPMTPALSSRMSDNSVNARTAFEPEDPVQLATSSKPARRGGDKSRVRLGAAASPAAPSAVPATVPFSAMARDSSALNALVTLTVAAEPEVTVMPASSSPKPITEQELLLASSPERENMSECDAEMPNMSQFDTGGIVTETTHQPLVLPPAPEPVHVHPDSEPVQMCNKMAARSLTPTLLNKTAESNTGKGVKEAELSGNEPTVENELLHAVGAATQHVLDGIGEWATSLSQSPRRHVRRTPGREYMF